MSFTPPATWRHEWTSPHHSPRRDAVTAIVLHADASPNARGTLGWLGDPVSKVSYHIVVDRDGTVFQVVPPERTAWHAGESSLGKQRFVNRFSVGVCLSNRNDGKEAYPTAQLASAAEVCAVLAKHYGIPVDRITTHAVIAPGRKTDPRGLDLTDFRARVAALLTE